MGAITIPYVINFNFKMAIPVWAIYHTAVQLQVINGHKWPYNHMTEMILLLISCYNFYPLSTLSSYAYLVLLHLYFYVCRLSDLFLYIEGCSQAPVCI
jgi:hypothetical protein